MAQNRDAPAFQEYAAAMMAKIDYRVLTLQQRGLLMSMRFECWVNKALPKDPSILARYLGFERSEIEANLPAVMLFFAVKDGVIVCPELEDYRAHLEAIKQKQSDGGKKGQELKREKSKQSNLSATQGNPSSEVTLRLPSSDLKVLSSVQFSQVKQSQNQSSEKGFSQEDTEWVSDYDKVSNGE